MYNQIELLRIRILRFLLLPTAIDFTVPLTLHFHIRGFDLVEHMIEKEKMNEAKERGETYTPEWKRSDVDLGPNARDPKAREGTDGYKQRKTQQVLSPPGRDHPSLIGDGRRSTGHDRRARTSMGQSPQK